MTLQELLENIPAAEKGKRVPSVVKLAKESVPFVTDTIDADTSVTVYSNGYVLYQKNQWVTVFPLHGCTDYVYKDPNVKSFIPFEEFMDQPWQVRVLMEGYDRMEHNCERRKEGRAVSIDIDNNEAGHIELSDMGAGDALRILVERESKREEEELLHENLERLTKRQREVLILCAGEGKTSLEAAKLLGISRQAVSENLRKSLRHMRKIYGVDEKCGGRNCFCRI
ncbi:sigma-70 family RNA polymerase sigma factor [Porcincola intestinalis]|uniref:Sigma-70 family RNA polymerase sigma factor n=1 Tax=Porcincola intestinalis TaxID=2606632 RepID=A0A6L5X0E2_9FIRM|nr:sigma-70 family RNA polymerase sigma factor [Porcincola intestinalis]MCI6767636.1 sigma-70 family RNA polymerase sigma factor [Lachnospiraceae bacterium]MDD7060504.1 sigma-70 family RNA polymerase sigma factor [Porcincola intestinalis]MDY5282525.1 sigma-70 family RNA polymerase sigma factor [Porcincola intestinalis]MSS13839.1 sigma-70 family RNA polymerase sigma factor [Porcincola intestinalis]